MALQKQGISVNFALGLDTKTDPFQLQLGRFEALSNSVFDKLGRLTKRNGFGFLPSLPDRSTSFVTTFKNNLTAIGNDIKVFSPGLNSYTSKGRIAPLSLSTLSLVKNNNNQVAVDTAISANGLICVTYLDSVSTGSQTQNISKYVILNQETGQTIVNPTQVVSTFGTVSFQTRVFSLGSYFVLVLSSFNGSVYHLQYMPISSYQPNVVGSVTDFSTSYTASSKGAFDGTVTNNSLYLSWDGATGTGIKASGLTSTFIQSGVVTIASTSADIVSVTADTSMGSPVIWTSAYNSTTSAAVSVATGSNLGTLFSAKQFVASVGSITNIATVAQNGVARIYYEVDNRYSYDTSLNSNFINQIAINQTGSLSAITTLARSVGLASKGFYVGSQSYVLASYSSPFQPTYFLLNSTGGVVARLAYSNGGGYDALGLTGVSVNQQSASFGYLTKDLVQAVNKGTAVSSQTQTAGIYSQTGINLATINFGTDGLSVAETANNLHLNGGFLWMYDGQYPVEQNFHLYPDSVEVSNPNSVSSGGSAVTIGSLSSQNYFYQATYEWTDNQGNSHKSSPSIPVQVTTTSSFSAAVIKVPTIRLTYKTSNPVKIVIYRWSTGQQEYFQVTSITNPILNDPTIDSISYTDTKSDAAILGNNLLYTTGGVLENSGSPSFVALTEFDSRLWGIDSEDQNLEWYSKPLVEGAPVEMSALQTVFVSPNAGAQGPTGPMRSHAPMDDKLILFKKNAIYYINGVGPDSTGANNQYSQPTFITSTVGCDNQNSIIMTPNGLMFQSDKGIWILGRDLSTRYIGKEVEEFNADVVLSALAIPGTNQVRFTLDSGITLMFDYFTGQWGSFKGIPGISSTLYNDLHTFINSSGQVLQETPGVYLDGSTPVVMSFRTGWISLAGLQGYKRFYWMDWLGQYQSPHRLTIGIGYDYESSVTQQATYLPSNYSAQWGVGSTWGSVSVWGESKRAEQWQVNVKEPTCQAFQITFNEYFDPTVGTPAGAGLTLSGLDLVVGLKKTYPRNISAKNRVG